ncbi:unnamed protein product [Orchesella dallaii]|uniref:Uncharacterized protein n=1 Tax=Orchesella dallaii TaxID=48710 RepID=A0ABP1QLM0_9HEXA
MNGQVIEEPSTDAQLLSRNSFVLMCLQVLLDNVDMAVNDIKAVINRKRNDISKKQESIQLKYNNYTELAMWLQGRFRRNKYYTAYDKRVEPMKAKFASVALDFNDFALRFKAAEQQLADMELAISNDRDRVSAIQLANVSFETLQAEVGHVKKIVP